MRAEHTSALAPANKERRQKNRMAEMDVRRCIFAFAAKDQMDTGDCFGGISDSKTTSKDEFYDN